MTASWWGFAWLGQKHCVLRHRPLALTNPVGVRDPASQAPASPLVSLAPFSVWGKVTARTAKANRLLRPWQVCIEQDQW